MAHSNFQGQNHSRDSLNIHVRILFQMSVVSLSVGVFLKTKEIRGELTTKHDDME